MFGFSTIDFTPWPVYQLLFKLIDALFVFPLAAATSQTNRAFASFALIQRRSPDGRSDPMNDKIRKIIKNTNISLRRLPLA